MKLKNITAAFSAACLVGVGLIASATGASAVDGQQYLGATALPAPGGLLTSVSGVSTEFSPTTSYAQANNTGGSGDMWDPGVYAVGLNPNNLHTFWADWSTNTTPTLFVNGFTDRAHQLVYAKTVEVEPCEPGNGMTFTFSANAANIVNPAYSSEFDTGSVITVEINGTVIGSANTSGHTAADLIEITGFAAVPDGTLDIAIYNDGQAYGGNDFGISNLSLVQNGVCTPPCVPTVKGVWFNYTGKYSGGNVTPPALNDPKWHALPATPGGEHALSLRGFNKPYNPGADKGKGDWFVWKDLGTTCPA